MDAQAGDSSPAAPRPSTRAIVSGEVLPAAVGAFRRPIDVERYPCLAIHLDLPAILALVVLQGWWPVT